MDALIVLYFWHILSEYKNQNQRNNNLLVGRIGSSLLLLYFNGLADLIRLGFLYFFPLSFGFDFIILFACESINFEIILALWVFFKRNWPLRSSIECYNGFFLSRLKSI